MRSACQTITTSQPSKPLLCGCTGYTLIELVSVAALAVVLISISVGGYHLWTRDTSVDAAQRLVRASLTRARAYALAHNVETRFIASNTTEYCFTVLDYRATPTNDWVSFTSTNQLPRYVGVDMEVIPRDGDGPETNPQIFFAPDGTLRWDDTLYEDPENKFEFYLRIVLFHSRIEDYSDRRYHRYLDVSRLTGFVHEVPPGKEDTE